MGDEGIIKICEVLKSNNALTQLNLSGKRKVIKSNNEREVKNGLRNKTGNRIRVKGIIKISEMMKTNSTLIDLKLSGTLICKSARINKMIVNE